MDSKDEQPPHPQSPSFSSLPNDILINIFARISKSYYSKLSLVCKTFHYLTFSYHVYSERLRLKTNEDVVHVCLQLPTHKRPSWFVLWMNPDQTLTNDLEKKKPSNGNTLLVPVPSPCSPRVPQFLCTIGLEKYAISRYHSYMWVRDKDIDNSIYAWRQAPSMTLARESPVMDVLDGKIYVMGGCRSEESANWAEVFNPKTQTWESLPDPGAKLRSSSIKRMDMNLGEMIYVQSSLDVDYVYYPKERIWDITAKLFHIESKCMIDNVWYCCGVAGVLWYSTEREIWIEVNGLAVLDRIENRMVEIANYGGKLLIFGEEFVWPNHKKEIWCSLVTIERRNNDNEVWGNIEWASFVLTVPSSYVFLRSVVSRV